MRRILILGGYGAVGREAAAALVRLMPEASVVVAGRNPDKAPPIAGATAMRVDAANGDDLARALDGSDAVLMCAEMDNARIARACLERGVAYLDVSATHRVLAEIEELDGVARSRGTAAVLSVGLVPGAANLLAAYCAARSGAAEVETGVLLGSGERHGPAALAWTLDGLGELEDSWRMRFPGPYGRRTIHRFPFSDQYTLPGTLGLERARTGMCLDSRSMTALLAAARRPSVRRLLRLPRVRGLLLTALSHIHLGGDGFAVAVRSGGSQASFAGRRQSRATGFTAALLIRRLPDLPPGVNHIEQLVDPAEFLTELASHGFILDLGG